MNANAIKINTVLKLYTGHNGNKQKNFFNSPDFLEDGKHLTLREPVRH